MSKELDTVGIIPSRKSPAIESPLTKTCIPIFQIQPEQRGLAFRNSFSLRLLLRLD